jgi:hypothetical protein
MTKTSQAQKEKKKCRHDWRIGAYIGCLDKGRVKRRGLYIFCYKCSKKIKAYYSKPI